MAGLVSVFVCVLVLFAVMYMLYIIHQLLYIEIGSRGDGICFKINVLCSALYLTKDQCPCEKN